MSPRAYFERLDAGTYRATPETGGGWDPEELHFSPLGGLLVHAIRAHASAHGTPGLQLSRVSFDILGRLAIGDYAIQVEISRPGRTIELIRATAAVAGRTVVEARAWMLIASETRAVAGGEPPALPRPATVAPWRMTQHWPGGFVASLDIRAVEQREVGRATAWVTTPVELLAGEPDPVASFVALIDIANGIAPRQKPTEWLFPNVDLTLHLHREPEYSWVGLDTTVVFGPSGLGVTSTVLHDERGPVGVANQAVTVRRVD